MIARRIPMRNASKSRVVRLAKYLEDKKSSSRVQDVTITGCYSPDVEGAALEMMAVQAENRQAKSDKTYHLIISFREGERPARDTITAIEKRFCENLGYGEHQRISVLHGDTENLHLHVAINKIHPETLRIHEPYYDYKTLARTCSQLEKEYGLAVDNHTSRNKGRPSVATSMEKAGGLESLTGWIQRNCLSQLQNAKNWKEFHHVCLENGLSLRARGNGFVFVSDKIHVKASSVDRGLSKKNLEMRLGVFEEYHENIVMPDKVYRRKPLAEGHEKLWRVFQKERAESSGNRQQIQEDRQKMFDSALQDFRLRNFLISQMTSGRVNKMILYYLSRKKLRQQARKDQWMDWLRETSRNERNPHASEALALLSSRKTSGRGEGGYLSGIEKEPMGTPEVVTRKGTRIFLGNIRERDGRILIPNNPTPQEIRELKSIAEKHFDKVAVHGDAELKELFGVAGRKPQAVMKSQSKVRDMDSGMER